MVRRRLGGWLLAASILSTGVCATAATAAESTPVQLVRLRADPRMCPSPRCGGYFVSRVNARTTLCLDGIARPACYVAGITLPPRSRPGVQAVLARSLAEGAFAPYRGGTAESLATFVASRVWEPTSATGDGSSPVYRVVDTGIRCITAPCFSLRATVANATRSVRLSGVFLGAPGISGASLRKADDLLAKGGVLVSGSLRTNREPGWPAAGRVLDATQVWLPA